MNQQTYQTQFRKVFFELKREPQTMLEVSVKTGVLRANICRYIRTLRKQNKVAATKIGKCSISKNEAHFYATNQAMFPAKTQMDMSEGGEYAI